MTQSTTAAWTSSPTCLVRFAPIRGRFCDPGRAGGLRPDCSARLPSWNRSKGIADEINYFETAGDTPLPTTLNWKLALSSTILPFQFDCRSLPGN
jgi:hypothetical protein